MSEICNRPHQDGMSATELFNSDVNRFVREAFEATVRQALGPVVLAKFASQ